jgi:hypothetical protein
VQSACLSAVAVAALALACAKESTAPLPRVASVQVQPESAWVPVGGSWPFAAVARDSSGRPLFGRAIHWSAADSRIGTVSPGGAASGRDTGITTIRAEADGHVGSAVLTVLSLVADGAWPNEPQDFHAVADDGFAALSGSGWSLFDNTQNLVSLQQDSTAPFSPPFVLQYSFPIGFPGGIGPGAATRDLPNLTNVYTGIWWKVSSPWQGHPANVNKVQILVPAEGGDIYMVMYGTPGGPYELRVIPQFKNEPTNWLIPNVNHVPVTLGVWHRVEWYLSYTTVEPATGSIRWWLDGTLLGSYTNVPFPRSPMTEYKVSAIWGGLGGVKTENDYYWYDDVHLSGR